MKDETGMVNATSEISLLLASCVMTSGTTAVGLAGVMDTGENTVLSESTLIPFGLFLAGLAMTTTVVWKVATHKAATDGKLKSLLKRMDRLERIQEQKHKEK